jgi:hypothetical protein
MSNFKVSVGIGVGDRKTIAGIIGENGRKMGLKPVCMGLNGPLERMEAPANSS